MPANGGIIGVGKIQKQRTTSPTYNGFYIPIENIADSQESGVASFNYFTIKVDNTDMMSSDVRLIDEDGLPNSYGRVEVRKGGIWGYVTKMTDASKSEVCNYLYKNNEEKA